MRHALNKFPDCQYIWFLHQDAFIMNPKISLHKDILAPGKLNELMMRNQPVALPDSIIHTYQALKPDNVDLVVTQDAGGMSPDSMVIRNTEWAEFFLDTWYDPLYRGYNFQKAEIHALVSLLLTLPASGLLEPYSKARIDTDKRCKHRSTSCNGTPLFSRSSH